MSQHYTQKDLGYPRSPTVAMIRVTFDNDEEWDVPLQAIADSRDEHYREDTVHSLRVGDVDEYDLAVDWFSNNMNWSDVSPYAIRVPTKNEQYDYEDGFGDALKMIVGKV